MFLRKIERYTKTDMVYLVGGGFWSLLSQVIGSGTSFIAVVLLANVLPKETLGQYRFVLSLIPILTIFTLPEIGTALTRAVARGTAVDLQAITQTKIRFGLIGTLIALILGAYYFYAGNTLLAYALGITALFLPFIETFYVYLAYYKGKQNFKTAAIYESLSRFFHAAILISVALATTNTLILLFAFLFGQAISRYFFYRITLSKIKHDTDLTKEKEDDDPVSYGKKLSILSVIGAIEDNWDKLLVWHFLGAEMLAIYYIALTIPKNIVLVFNVIPRVAFPKFSQSKWGEHERESIMKKLVIFLLVLLVPTAIYIFLMPYALPVFFKEYSVSLLPALIVAPILFTSPMNAIIVHMLYARKAVKKLVSIQVFGTCIFTLVFLLAYKTLGVGSAGLALVSSEALSLLLGLFLLKRLPVSAPSMQ